MTRLLPLGLFLLLTGAYVLTGPGRIDIIDGQYRFEVAYNLAKEGRPIVLDGRLPRLMPGRDHKYYSYYGPTGSIMAVPLVATARMIAPHNRHFAQFLFSFTSAILAALAGVLLFWMYRQLGLERRAAVGWTLAVGFCTLLWPLATSTFDQAQHACVLLAAVAAGRLAGLRSSTRWAACAGIGAGTLVTYQETYIVLAPAIALACLAEGESIKAALRTAKLRSFIAGALMVVALLVVWNVWRVGTPFAFVRANRDHPGLGNPLIGAVGLLVSPGKGLLFYCPPIVIAAFGWPVFWRRHRALARAIFAIAAVQFGLIASLTFWGGDWTWGPRYLVVTLPLLCLALPFAKLRRSIVATILFIGFAVQILGLAVDWQRFMLQRGLPDFFWLDKAYYFEHSALAARPGEILDVYSADVHVGDMHAITPNPYGSPTYSPFGNMPSERARSPQWMHGYAIFDLPRPWPLWMSRVAEDQMPIPWRGMLGIAIVILFAGIALTTRGVLASRSVPP